MKGGQGASLCQREEGLIEKRRRHEEEVQREISGKEGGYGKQGKYSLHGEEYKRWQYYQLSQAEVNIVHAHTHTHTHTQSKKGIFEFKVCH